MTFLLRGLVILIGGAFALAVANLFISGVPETQGIGVEVAALAPDGTQEQPGPIATDAPQATPQAAEQPGLGQLFMNLAQSVVSSGPEASVPIQPDQIATLLDDEALAAIVTGASDGRATEPTTPPLSAGGPLPNAGADPIGADIDALSAAWSGWMAANGIETGAFAMILPDGTEYGTGMGRTVDEIRPVMSMSKTITGLCVDQLLLENGLGWDTTLAQIAPQMSQAGLTPRAWNEHITLAELVTHTSGLAPDLTQSNMVSDTHGALGLHRRWATAALQQEAMTGEAGEYFYSNTNYAVLGVVVEALSGESYAQACMDRIVAPAGIDSAVIEGRYGSLSSYAGWELSAMDYARLASHWFAEDQPHMTDPRPDFDGYAIGYSDNGDIIHHAGRFCQRDHPTGGVGSLFIHSRDGTVISANWDGCVQPAIRDVLLEQLLERL